MLVEAHWRSRVQNEYQRLLLALNDAHWLLHGLNASSSACLPTCLPAPKPETFQAGLFLRPTAVRAPTPPLTGQFIFLADDPCRCFVIEKNKTTHAQQPASGTHAPTQTAVRARGKTAVLVSFFALLILPLSCLF